MTERVKSIARAQFLGTQRIEIGGEVITPEAERLFGMIVRLSVPLGRLTSRQTMMETLWPGADEANARHNLRQTVYKARELGLVVESGEDGLRLDPRHWSCDWDDATGDVSGEWLPDYEPEFSDELRSWIGSQRIGVHALVRPRLVRSLQAARASGDLIVADRHARQLLQIDELNEEATLTRAELMAMQGAKVDALRLLDAYLHEIGRVGSGKDAALPAQLLRRRIAEKLPSVSYSNGSTHHGPLVARTEEIKRLLASLFDARAGRGAATVLCGSEGIGKSRLLFEVRKSAVLQGMLIVELSCESAPAAVPFSALRALTHRLLELPGALGITPEALSAIREWTGGTTAAPDDCPVVEIEDLLASIAEETPLLLLLEHAERMDAESLGRLDRLYRRGVGRYHALMLTSCTTRVPTESPVELRGIERLPLRPLTLVAVRSIVTAYAAAELPRATEDQIACAAVFAEGNPMYGIEMLGLILDPGSPDVIPWRVKVAVERIVGEMSEVERRVVNFANILRGKVQPESLERLLGVKGDSVATALNHAESEAWIWWSNGRLFASGLVANEVQKRIDLTTIRKDATFGGSLALESWKKEGNPADLYCAVDLFISAQHEDIALRALNADAGRLINTATATELSFWLPRARLNATDQGLRDMLDLICENVRAGAEYAIPSNTQNTNHAAPTSITAPARLAVQFQHTYASDKFIEDARASALDPNRSTNDRLTDATIALAAASNLGARKAIDTAFSLVTLLRSYPGASQISALEADVIYYTSTGNRERAIDSACQLALAVRSASNASDSCRALRIAAQAMTTFGRLESAGSLLRESRDIAAKLQYAAQIIAADLRLADNAIAQMELDVARAYLQCAASAMTKHGINVRSAVADLHYYSCWESIATGDTVRAAAHSRKLSKAIGKPATGTAALSIQCTQLASHSGPPIGSTMTASASIRACIGDPVRAAYEQRYLASLILFSRHSGDHDEVVRFAKKQFSRIEANGQPIWSFLRTLTER